MFHYIVHIVLIVSIIIPHSLLAVIEDITGESPSAVKTRELPKGKEEVDDPDDAGPSAPTPELDDAPDWESFAFAIQFLFAEEEHHKKDKSVNLLLLNLPDDVLYQILKWSVTDTNEYGISQLDALQVRNNQQTCRSFYVLHTTDILLLKSVKGLLHGTFETFVLRTVGVSPESLVPSVRLKIDMKKRTAKHVKSPEGRLWAFGVPVSEPDLLEEADSAILGMKEVITLERENLSPLEFNINLMEDTLTLVDLHAVLRWTVNCFGSLVRNYPPITTHFITVVKGKTVVDPKKISRIIGDTLQDLGNVSAQEKLNHLIFSSDSVQSSLLGCFLGHTWNTLGGEGVDFLEGVDLQTQGFPRLLYHFLGIKVRPDSVLTPFDLSRSSSERQLVDFSLKLHPLSTVVKEVNSSRDLQIMEVLIPSLYSLYGTHKVGARVAAFANCLPFINNATYRVREIIPYTSRFYDNDFLLCTNYITTLTNDELEALLWYVHFFCGNISTVMHIPAMERTQRRELATLLGEESLSKSHRTLIYKCTDPLQRLQIAQSMPPPFLNDILEKIISTPTEELEEWCRIVSPFSSLPYIPSANEIRPFLLELLCCLDVVNGAEYLFPRMIGAFIYQFWECPETYIDTMQVSFDASGATEEWLHQACEFAAWISSCLHETGFVDQHVVQRGFLVVNLRSDAVKIVLDIFQRVGSPSAQHIANLDKLMNLLRPFQNHNSLNFLLGLTGTLNIVNKLIFDDSNSKEFANMCVLLKYALVVVGDIHSIYYNVNRIFEIPLGHIEVYVSYLNSIGTGNINGDIFQKIIIADVENLRRHHSAICRLKRIAEMTLTQDEIEKIISKAMSDINKIECKTDEELVEYINKNRERS